MIIKKIKYTIIIFATFIITLSSFINLYDKRDKIFNKIVTSKNKYIEKKDNDYIEYNQKKFNLAQKIVNEGGYILHFRHAHREKWIDVAMYDSIEINNRLRAENEYFKDAVCLSSMGNIQAKMMGEIWQSLDVPVHKVITSPSCRARQTSNLVFGGFDEEKSILLHKGPYRENYDEFRKELRKFYLSLKILNGSNIIISAHNGLIEKKLFDEIQNMPDEFSLEEGGFYVIKKEDNDLVYVDKFNNFHHFNLQFKSRSIY